MGDTLRFAVRAAAVTWSSPRPRSQADDTGDVDSDYTSGHQANPEHLLAVRDILNQQKGDRGPDQWKPPRQEFWCDYATASLTIKKRWQLPLTADETAAIADMLRTCS